MAISTLELRGAVKDDAKLKRLVHAGLKGGYVRFCFTTVAID